MHKYLHYSALVFSFLSLMLVVANSAYVSSNRTKAEKIAENNQKIQAAGVFGQVYQALVRDLANVAINKKDDAVRGMLTSAGIQLQQNEPTKTKKK